MSSPADNFSFDEWESTFSPLASGVASGSRVPPSSTSSVSTGEFNVFSMVGKKLSSGAGGETAAFSVFTADHWEGDLCFGLLRTGKFCIKPRLPQASTCGASSHSKKFQPAAGHFYLMENDTKVLCQPCFDGNFLSVQEIPKILSASASLSDWQALFDSTQDVDLAEWLLGHGSNDNKENVGLGLRLKPSPLPSKAMALKSPRVVEEQLQSSDPSASKAGLLLAVPTLSFDFAETVDLSEVVGGDPATVQQVSDLGRFVFNRFSSLKSKWARAFQEVEATYLVLTTDISALNTQLAGLVQDVGLPPQPAPFKSVWDGLVFLHQSLRPSVGRLTDTT